MSPKLFDSSNHCSHQPLPPAPSKISKQAKPCAIHFATFYLRSVNTSALDDPAGELLKLINSLLLNYSSSHVLQPSRRSPLETPLENLHGGGKCRRQNGRGSRPSSFPIQRMTATNRMSTDEYYSSLFFAPPASSISAAPLGWSPERGLYCGRRL